MPQMEGKVVVKPLGPTMAGRIVKTGMKDAPFNCIACHSLAGDDFVYLNDSVPLR